jgi:hypothetical protein
MTGTLRTHEISEIEPGVFYTILEPCSAAVLPHVLTPGTSHVWLVEHRPCERLLWAELPVPLASDAAAEPLRVRGVEYDLQMTTAEFLARVVPRLPGGASVILLQLDRPVPDSLRYRDVAARHAILRQNGWQLTFDLPHGGTYAEVTAADRRTLERILADPVIAAGKAAGDLP